MKKNTKRREVIILTFIGIVIISFIISFILMLSNDREKEFFGTVISLSILVVIMLVAGVIQFVPSIYKRRSRFLLITMWIMGFFWVVCSVMLIIGDLPNYYKDIPTVINSDYSSYEGKLVNYRIFHGKSTNTYFTIGNKEFHVSGEYNPGFLVEGRKYHVEYLPHTKYVMNLYRYGS